MRDEHVKASFQRPRANRRCLPMADCCLLPRVECTARPKPSRIAEAAERTWVWTGKAAVRDSAYRVHWAGALRPGQRRRLL